ncbi:alanine aminotransferase [Raphidocelis subcapitata]|uniref:Alanine aminotransferase n=1 Tax=Raphidocelis subcapitata TaxID=307507 RepID=A0A2V0P2P1_9CHLO|nr:alanine aminotransferase [Raphidocelis subcapitata]|eukprot:GBF93162.1 alanine aminotransferase [Raphidocelis subcapitata]
MNAMKVTQTAPAARVPAAAARPRRVARAAAPLGSTVSVDDVELPPGVQLPKLASKEGKVLHPDLINPNILKTQYAVRGEIYLKAEQMRREGRDIIFTNIGNPHNLGAKPKTFTRQVVALCAAPFLLDDPRTAELFPPDAIERARKLSSAFTGGIGSYSDSRGNPLIRSEVAAFIEARDGHAANPDHIFLTDGASPAVKIMLNALIRDADDAVLVPIPQYPLYSAAIQMFGGTLIPYDLDEAAGWALSAGALRAAVRSARAAGKCVRALALISPGNPTGQCLGEDNMRELINFAYNERILLMADEVYQELTYRPDRPFVSARKVLLDMGEPYASAVELVSFHSVSKGTSGECGLRGGYLEMTNILPATVEQLYKVSSVNLCPNSVGQIAVSCMVNPPAAGAPSAAGWAGEREAELQSLARRARMVTEAFNSLDGVSCNPTEGAMYAFPRLMLPPRAVAAAKAAGRAPDVYYCLRLLDETGVVTVPGSGFGQAEGTFHLRTTILPREEKMAEFVDKFRSFHTKFMAEFA